MPQSLEAKHKPPATWKQVAMEELKAFLGLLVATSPHKLPSIRNCWSSDLVLNVPAFSKVIPCNRFQEIWNNIRLCDNTKMPRAEDANFDKLYKVRQFIEDLKANLC